MKAHQPYDILVVSLSSQLTPDDVTKLVAIIEQLKGAEYVSAMTDGQYRRGCFEDWIRAQVREIAKDVAKPRPTNGKGDG